MPSFSVTTTHNALYVVLIGSTRPKLLIIRP